MTAIDETDQRILTMLEADGRATLAQLAQATGLSVSAAQSRVQKLEKRGIIKGYKAIIDQEQRGLPISAFVNVTPLDYSAESSIPDKLNNIDGIVSCYSVAGAPSFVLVVRVASPTALEELLNLIPPHGAGKHRDHDDSADLLRALTANPVTCAPKTSAPTAHDSQRAHPTSPKSTFMSTI